MNDELECNDGHYIELLDRVYIASSYVQMALEDHPVLEKPSDLKVIYDQAVDRLESLYQAVGQLDQTWS